LKGLSHEIYKVRKADAVLKAEGSIVIIDKARISQLPWGLRPWHVIHGYDMVTRETLSVLLKEVWPTSLTKQGSQTVDRESDCRIVPMNPGNAGEGKAATKYQNRNMPAKDLMTALRKKLEGYYRYYGVTGNFRMLELFRYNVRRLLYKWLNRRSQRKSFNWEEFDSFLTRFPLSTPKIYVKLYG